MVFVMYVLIPILQLLRPFYEEIVAFLRDDCCVVGVRLTRLEAKTRRSTIVDLCAICMSNLLILVAL